MKKQFISIAILATAVSLAVAEQNNVQRAIPIKATVQARATSGMPTIAFFMLPPNIILTTGDQNVDVKVSALRQEMNDKMRALQEEYQVKLKVLIGTRQLRIASSSIMMLSRPMASGTAQYGRPEEAKEQRGGFLRSMFRGFGFDRQ